ncbi:MAG TPA: hypothetical protein VNO21_09650, partial [Polyangiaceae bacterium]|nr:hypothetical protein [Polyangiaceae bacterium]
MAQVGLRFSLTLFPAVVLAAAGSMGACASQAPKSDSPDDPDGHASIGTQSGSDGGDDDTGSDATLADAFPDGSPEDGQAPHDAGVDVAAPVDAGPPLDCNALGAQGEPLQLGCTGLYASWPQRSISPNARPYVPAFTLWSDGAQKSRYIALPPGTTIDTSDMDEWR